MSSGPLHYEGSKLIVAVDPHIVLFYRSLIPKCHGVLGQRYPPHISVVRKEVPLNIDIWGKHEGEKVEFFYDSDTLWDSKYWWLNVYSSRLDIIRTELGLSNKNMFLTPPDGFEKVFHISIGNTKELSNNL